MSYLLIGTAGHVDHGKSSLIKALTGFWGDESDEEKRRGITIDLSFSYIKTPQKTIGFIDVPGHESLVDTMISGAFGFDASLVAIDANEGLMPQTKEHLAVLDFLGVKKCIVALTKCDLSDEKNIKNQIENIKNEFKNYKNLELDSVHQTSIKDEDSIKELKDYLQNLPNKEHINRGVFRYYIDRVFSLKGIGLVTTGTVLEGEAKLNQKVWVCDITKEALVKSIQIHNQSEEVANINQRAALGLGMVEQKELKKGMLLSQKGYIRGFKNIDVYVTCMDKKILPHNSKIKLHIGAKKVNATILHHDASENFTQGYSTIYTDEEVYCVYNDKGVISFKGNVIAGAKVLSAIYDPIKKNHKMSLLIALNNGDLKEVFSFLSKTHKKGFGLISSYQRFVLSHDEAKEIANELEDVILDEKALTIYPKSTLSLVIDIIKNIYEKNPYALLSPNSINQKYKWLSPYLSSLAFEALSDILENQNGVWVKKGVDAKNLIDNIQNRIYEILKEGDTAPLAPYNIYDELDIDRKTGDDALKSLTRAKKVVRLTHNFFICSDVLSRVMETCREIIKMSGYVDVKLLKERLQLSRKYLIAYLEYLDNFDDIELDGMKRKLKRSV